MIKRKNISCLCDSNREKQVILLVIPNEKGREGKSEGHVFETKGQWWHYLAVKKLSASLRGITFNHYSDFYCLNCVHSVRTINKPKSHKKIRENKDFCNVIMPLKDTKTLTFN